MAKVDYTFQSNAHIKRVARYVQMLERFFDDATEEFCKLFGKANYDGISQFFFEDYPTLKKKADSVVNSLSSSIYDVILTGTSAEWNKSNEVTDQMVIDLFKSRGVDIDKIKNSDVVDLFNNHDKALEAFQKRKIGGLSLSDKVWNMAEYHRLETQLALSIESGDSAAELARKVKKCLKEPDKLFRRVRDKHGELRLSKNAKAYHPGAGAYRSSVRNAQRLARTEINMAYREAEMQRYQDLDFIVGFEVKRSTHPYPCDICESHKGKYPKDFKFVSWHPQCRCYVVPILNTQEEFDKQSNSILRGKQYARKSVNTVTAPPEGFNQWIFDNKERILRANKLGTLPYYMRDNSTYINRALHSNVIKKALPPMSDIDVVGPSPIDTTKGILTVGDLEKKVDTHIRWMKDIDDDIALMFKRLDTIDMSDREKRELITDIKRKAAEITVKYLDDQGYTKGLVYIKEDINHSFGQDMSVLTRGMLSGKYQRDIVIYKDKYGVEFAFPIGAKIENLLKYDFDEISDFVQSLPKGFREQFKGIYFDDRMHPLDSFFVTIYPDFDGGGMYNGEYITVHHRYKEIRTFSFRFVHEIGHNIDRISSSQKWYDAMRKDKFACSGYALNAAKEDFAEAFSMAYNYFEKNPQNGLSRFEKMWPNRWDVMKDLFLKLLEM